MIEFRKKSLSTFGALVLPHPPNIIYHSSYSSWNSDYYQEMPQSHTTDQPTAPRWRVKER